MHKLIQFLKCIADETRFKLLKLLLEQSLCVCELTEILGKSQPCVSQHLRRFKEIGLVIEKKVDQWSYYEIDEEVYNKYLQVLIDLKNLDYCSVNLQELYESFQKVKSLDLCKIKEKGVGKNDSSCQKN